MPTTAKNSTARSFFFRSMSQYEKARASRVQPPLASTKVGVAIRLMIGVMGSRPYPAISSATPASSSTCSFFCGGSPPSSHCPATTPQTVWAVVERALSETQCPPGSFPLSCISSHSPILCPATKGWLNPSTGKKRYSASAVSNTTAENAIWNRAGFSITR